VSVGPTTDALRKERRRLEFLVWSKWRRPAPRRKTLPVAVILKRLATAFLVLTPLGRRIGAHFFCLRFGFMIESQGEMFQRSTASV
jgi:hypothetical protein